MKKFSIILILAMFAMAGCVKTPIMKNTDDIRASINDMRDMFVTDWASISGLIAGAYEGKTFNVPSGIKDNKLLIDELLLNKDMTPKDPSELSEYTKSKAWAMWVSLVVMEGQRLVKELAPDLMKYIPAGLLVGI